MLLIRRRAGCRSALPILECVPFCFWDGKCRRDGAPAEPSIARTASRRGANPSPIASNAASPGSVSARPASDHEGRALSHRCPTRERDPRNRRSCRRVGDGAERRETLEQRQLRVIRGGRASFLESRIPQGVCGSDSRPRHHHQAPGRTPPPFDRREHGPNHLAGCPFLGRCLLPCLQLHRYAALQDDARQHLHHGNRGGRNGWEPLGKRPGDRRWIRVDVCRRRSHGL